MIRSIDDSYLVTHGLRYITSGDQEKCYKFKYPAIDHYVPLCTPAENTRIAQAAV